MMSTVTLDSSIKLFVNSDLIYAATTIDGPKTGEILSIILEKPDGSRFAHPTNFQAFDVICDERTDYETLVVARPEAQAEADAALGQIAREGRIDLAQWTEIQPAYGSEAYVTGGWEQITLANEMNDAF